MTEEPFDNNLELESPDPNADESAPTDITPPPLPNTGYETQVLGPDETPEEEDSAMVITTPPIVPESPKELEMPSPFEQEQPELITVDSSLEPEPIIPPPAAPPAPAAEPPSGDAPKKNNKTLIIVIVIIAVLLLCCCCVIFGFGAMFWQDIAWELGLNMIQSFVRLFG